MANRWGNSERLYVLGSKITADGDCSHEIQRGLLLGRKAMTNLDRIDDFELWCWRRLFWVPWTTRRSNQPILKEVSPEYSLEGLMLKLKLQYFGHLMWRTDSLEKTLMLGKIEGGRRRGQHRIDGWMASVMRWTWVWVSSGSWWWTGKPGVLQSMGVAKSQTWLSNWTEWTH